MERPADPPPVIAPSPAPQPAAAPSPQPAAAPAPKKGCGTGCLVILIILVLLFGGLAFAGWRYYNANVRPVISDIAGQFEGAVDELGSLTTDGGAPVEPVDTCVVFRSAGDRLTGWDSVDCDTAHDGEVTHTWELAGGEFRGVDAMRAEAAPTCAEYFEAYVGIDEDASVYASGVVVPSDDSWSAGDRSAWCLVVADDGAPTVGSAMHSSR